jgi:hypothetical protein
VDYYTWLHERFPTDLKVTFILFSSTGTFFEKMDPKINQMAKDNDYVANFDPKVYLETYYCKIEGHMRLW